MFPVKSQPGRGLMRCLVLEPGSKKVGEEGDSRGTSIKRASHYPNTFSIFTFKE